MDIESGLSIQSTGTLQYGILPYIHFILLGNGKYWIVPLGVGLLMSSFQLSYMYFDAKSHDAIAFLYAFSFFLEIWANLVFGYFWLKHGLLESMLDVTSDIGKKQFFLYSLQIIALICYIIAWINQSFYLRPRYFTGDTDDDTFGSTNPGLGLFNTFVFQFTVFLNYYMCGIWIWIVYIIYNVWCKELKPKITSETLDDYTEMFIEFNTGLEKHSKYWTFNHCIRTVTGVVITVASIYFAAKKSAQLASSITFVCSYYGSIWLTYLSAGYVNQYIRSKMMKAIGLVKPSEKTKVDIMYEITRLDKVFRGLYVSGLRMTIEAAISIGSVVITLLTLAVKIHMIKRSQMND